MHLSQRCNFEHDQNPMVEAGKRASIAVDLRVSDPLKLLMNYFLGEDDFSLDPEPRGGEPNVCVVSLSEHIRQNIWTN